MSNFQPISIPVARETTTATPAIIVFNDEVDTLIGVPAGVAIFKLNANGSQQLLAVVQGNISSTLDSDQYVFL